jgi:hypothetical protein
MNCTFIGGKEYKTRTMERTENEWLREGTFAARTLSGMSGSATRSLRQPVLYCKHVDNYSTVDHLKASRPQPSGYMRGPLGAG